MEPNRSDRRVSEHIVHDPLVLRRSDPITRLLDLLATTPQDIFPVVDGDEVVGTVSDYDLLEAIGPNRRTFPFGPRKLVREGVLGDVEDVMSPRPATVRNGESLEAALRRMQELRLPQLVVVDENRRLVGLLRARDVFLALSGEEA